MKYIVEIDKGCWLAPWTGDPGRTVVMENAKEFNTRLGAMRALNKARMQRRLTRFMIHEVATKED